MHSSVNNRAHRLIHIIGAQILQQIHHLSPLRPQIDLGERTIITQSNSLPTVFVFALHVVEPMRLPKSIGGGDLELGNTLLIQRVLLIEPCRSFVAHNLTENGTGFFESREDRRHPKVSSRAEFVEWVVHVVMKARHFPHSIPEELPIIVQSQEAWNIQLVEIHRWITYWKEVNIIYSQLQSRSSLQLCKL